MAQKLVPILIPQMGEGIRDAIVVAFLKEPGDSVRQGEALLEVETEKMTGPVEAPCDGIISEWRVPVGTLLPIGGEAGSLTASQDAPAPAIHHSAVAPSAAEPAPPPPAPLRNDQLAPRTRKMLMDYGLIGQADEIPRQGEKLLPADIERFLAARTVAPTQTPVPGFRKLTTAERWQAHRFATVTPSGIPATLSVRVAWQKLESTLEQRKVEPEAHALEATVLMAWCVARAMPAHPLLRTRLHSDSECVIYDPGAVGIAAASPNQTLAITSILCPEAEDWSRFRAAAREGLEVAITGRNQVGPETTVILSNMMPYRIYHAVPAVIAPAVATIFAGDVSWMATGKGPQPEFSKMFYLTMTFDHRLLGGVAAAQFLHDVANRMETLSGLGAQTAPSHPSRIDTVAEAADRLRQKVAELQGVPPSLVEPGIKFSDFPRDSLGFVNAELVAESLHEFVLASYPGMQLSLDDLKSKSLQELAEDLGGREFTKP